MNMDEPFGPEDSEAITKKLQELFKAKPEDLPPTPEGPDIRTDAHDAGQEAPSIFRREPKKSEEPAAQAVIGPDIPQDPTLILALILDELRDLPRKIKDELEG